MPDIIRESSPNTVAVDTSGNLANCTEINAVGMSGAVVNVPSGSTITSLAVYHSPTFGGTYLPLYRTKSDLSIEAVTVTGISASKAITLPIEIFPCRYMKLVGNAAGNVNVSLKS